MKFMYKDKLFLRIVSSIHPPIKIPNKWRAIWNDEKMKGFLSVNSTFFIFWSLIYVFHYYYIDIPMGKTPLSDWAFYRFSCATLSVIGLVLGFLPKVRKSPYSYILICLAGLYFTFMQSVSMVWRVEIPYMYVVIIPVLSILSVATSTLLSVLYMFAAVIVSLPGILSRPDETLYIVSAFWVGVIFVGIVRSTYSNKVSAFISNQENIESKKKIIELQLGIENQIKSFLPKVVYKEFKSLVEEKGEKVEEAFDHVTELKDTKACVLYSDIRGFTEKSKISEEYLRGKVIPNLKDSSRIVENYNGVPRQVGDLMFAYFRDKDDGVSIECAFQAAFELLIKTNSHNTNEDFPNLERHAILSFGDVIVGNFGGDEHSREVTVHGAPANIGSRIDPVTKLSIFKDQYRRSCIILTPNVYFKIGKFLSKYNVDEFSVGDYQVRDFAELTSLYVLELTDVNIELFLESDEELRSAA
jgi:class 3 adenylate cyclase